MKKKVRRKRKQKVSRSVRIQQFLGYVLLGSVVGIGIGYVAADLGIKQALMMFGSAFGLTGLMALGTYLITAGIK